MEDFFTAILMVLYPFFLLFGKFKMKRIIKEFEQCDSDYDWTVDYKTELRNKYQLYKQMIEQGPIYFHSSPSKSLLKEDVKDSRFALFLRGFEKDKFVYDYKHKAQRQFESFSEFHFMNHVNKYMNAYAVGITKELEPAIGSNRIYLPNETSKDDVIELMEKAAVIIILINDKPNCIWEIEQSTKYPLKTIYIVDDYNKYTVVLNEFQKMNCSGIPKLPFNFSCFIYLGYPEEIVVNPLQNKEEDYERAVNYIFKELFGFRNGIVFRIKNRNRTINFLNDNIVNIL